MTNDPFFDNLDRGGLTDERYDLDRPVNRGLLLVPSVIRVTNDCLQWPDFHTGETYYEVEPGPKVLEEFVRSSNASADRILNYARRFGPLGYGSSSEKDGWQSEPLDDWRKFGRRVRAILNISAQLHQGELGNSKDWDIIKRPGRGQDEITLDERLIADRHDICFHVNGLTSNVRQMLRWSGRSPELMLVGSERVTSYIAIQLLLAVSRSKGLITCSSCGELYSPRRRPAASKRRYCQDCGQLAAWRDAQADRRAKKKNHK